MKTVSKILASVVTAGVFAMAGSASADSTYGYSSTGATGITATSKVEVVVKVPTLILLRVGSTGATIDTLTFNAAGNVASAPGSTLADGNNQAATWDGAAPTFANAAGQALTTYAWTNSPGGGSLSCATVANTKFLAADGLTSADVKVASGTGLAHPGADTSCAGPAVTFAKNTAMTGTWTYSILGTALANAAAGEHKQTTTYTATAL